MKVAACGLLLATVLVGGGLVDADDVTRSLTVDGLDRSYRVHFPPNHEVVEPAAVVLVLHGAALNAVSMQHLTQFDILADREGFVTAYLNGTGPNPFMLTFNAGGLKPPFDRNLPDDVRYTEAVLDDLEALTAVDRRRVFACGYSNGGMMCYRLAAELSDRIAAIGSISGTQAIPLPLPPRPVPVIHFHGSKDMIVPPNGPDESIPPFLTFLSVDETINLWVGQNECPPQPVIRLLPNTERDGTTVIRRLYAPCAAGTEVPLYWIVGGGHTWPGAATPPNPITGLTTKDISANELLWEFFSQHPLPEPGD
jgi:polyhydroxybutyrate depolymerase